MDIYEGAHMKRYSNARTYIHTYGEAVWEHICAKAPIGEWFKVPPLAETLDVPTTLKRKREMILTVLSNVMEQDAQNQAEPQLEHLGWLWRFIPQD